MRLRLFVLSTAVSVSLLCWGCGPAAPLTVATAGVTASAVLDKMDDKLTHIIQQAAAAGSLLSTKAARDLQLEVSAARAQLHDELNQNWDRLDQEKVSGLRALDQAVDQLDQNIQKIGTIEDDLSLDIDQKLNAIPFLKKAITIRRVEGSSQYFKTEGIYVLKVKGNLFNQMADKPSVTIGDEALAAEAILPKPPYDLVVNIPVNLINKKFQDRALSYLTVTIKQKISNRDYSFELWRDKYRDAEYKFSLELFPKFPAAYRLTEYDEEPFVDTTKTEIAPARVTYISGCGNSGCNAYFTVCTDVPPGAQPIQAVDFQDSFQGWGGFGQQTPTSTGVCATYWQHSHNVGRNVGFNVQYHPLGSHIVEHDINLEALSPDAVDTFNAKDSHQKTTTSAPSYSIVTVIQQILPGIRIGIPSLKVNQSTPPIPVDSVAPAQLVLTDHGAVRLGRTYSAKFSSSMKSFDLVFRTFTGEELVVTPAKSSRLVDASPLENQTTFKRMTVVLKTPW